jgi:PHD/YefM family antitoxin component YafN of YafNO toxin-antitoxin module
MFVPPKTHGPQEPTVVREIAIEQLRKKLKTIREEVENSGAAYRVMVNGPEAAVFCPTQAA